MKKTLEIIKGMAIKFYQRKQVFGYHLKGLGIFQKYFYGNFKEMTAVKIVSGYSLALLAILLKLWVFPFI